VTILASGDRATLRRFLEERFTFDELVTLTFDLGVNYQALPHATTAQLSMALVDYFERRTNLTCLLTEVLRQRHDPALAQLLADLPPGSLHPKVQIIIATDIQLSPNEIIADLAAKLKVGVDQVELVSAAWGSLRLLFGLPQDAYDSLLGSGIRTLVNGRYTVISVTAFDSLDAASQKTWRQLAAIYPSWPPAPWISSAQGDVGNVPSERLPVVSSQELLVSTTSSSFDPTRFARLLEQQTPEMRALSLIGRPLDQQLAVLQALSSELERERTLACLPPGEAEPLRGQLAAGIHLPDELMDKILSGNCVLFLGAGVSAEAGMPTSDRLCADLGFSGDSLTDAAEKYRKKQGQRALNDKIRSVFDEARRYIQPEKTSFPFIANIPHLTSLIVTTNYDDLLEQALRAEGKNPTVVCRENDMASINGSRCTVIKLHGDLGLPETMILTAGDYATLLAKLDKPGGFAGQLAGLLEFRTIIFVGYSMADEDFKRIMRFVTNRLVDAKGQAIGSVHYAVLPWSDQALNILSGQTEVRTINGKARDFFEAVYKRTSEFLNRKGELEELCERNSKPFIEISGNAGSGKSMFLQGMSCRYRVHKKHKIVATQLEPGTTTMDCLRDLAVQFGLKLSELGKTDQELIDLLLANFRGRQVLVTIDKTDSAPQIALELERYLLLPLKKLWDDRKGGGRVVFAGRDALPWSYRIKNEFVSRTLTPFESLAVEEMVGRYFVLFRGKVVSPEECRRVSRAILKLTGSGHPGLIKTVLEEVTDPAKGTLLLTAADIEHYVRAHEQDLSDQRLLPFADAILAAAKPAERAILDQALCVFRCVSPAILELTGNLLAEYGVDETPLSQPEAVFTKLKALRILRESETDCLNRLDSVIAALLAQRLWFRNPELYRRAHEVALRIYDQLITWKGSQSQLAYATEGLYHLQCLREIGACGDVLADRVRKYLPTLRSRDDPQAAFAARRWAKLLEQDEGLKARMRGEALRLGIAPDQIENWVAEQYDALDKALNLA
jgi:hypothetical protein